MMLSIFKKKQSLEELHDQAQYWDCYNRQEAIVRIGELGDSSSIPILIGRINDWVPQVRKGAKTALLSYLDSPNASIFISLLPEILQARLPGFYEDDSVTMEN